MVFALAIHVAAIEAPADHGSLAGDLPPLAERFRASFIVAERQLVKALLQ